MMKLHIKQLFIEIYLKTRIPRKAASHLLGQVTGATIRTWLLNKFISFLAVLSWTTGLKENVDKVPSGAYIFPASVIPLMAISPALTFRLYSLMIMEH